jgi:uncharacterized protein YggE
MHKAVARALVALALAPLAASAQESMPIPAPPLAAGLTPERGALPAGGIVESGRATIAVPADRIKLTIRAYAGVPSPGSGPTTAQSVSDLEKLVVDTMRANGIPDAHLQTAVLGNVNTPDAIVGTLSKPTHDSIDATEKRVLAALPASTLSALRNINVEGALETDGCGPIVERARAAAFADARKRAEALATVAGVHLGVLTAASEADQTAGCTDLGTTVPSFNGANFQATDGILYITVSVNANFAIRP